MVRRVCVNMDIVCIFVRSCGICFVSMLPAVLQLSVSAARRWSSENGADAVGSLVHAATLALALDTSDRRYERYQSLPGVLRLSQSTP